MFNPALPSRILNNLACCMVGLRLMEAMLARLGLAWGQVFSVGLDASVKYLEYGVREYLLDGGESNKSIVEQTLEVIDRMGLTTDEFRTLPDGNAAFFFKGFYDRYTNEEYYIDNQFAGWSQLDNSSGVDTRIKLEYIDCVFRKWDGEHGEEVKLTEELWRKLKPAAYPFSIVNQSDNNKVYANAKEAKIEILFGDFKKEYTTEGESCYE